MISRLNRMLQYARDAVMLVFSVVLAATTYGKWVQEPVFYVAFGLGVVIVFLTVTNLALLVRKVKGRGYFFFNAIAQLPITFIIFGLLGVLGLVLMGLNIVVLITLKQKKEIMPPTIS